MGGDGLASPEQVAIWEAEPLPPSESFGDKFRAVKGYFAMGPKKVLFGQYSYGYLCMPTFWPWKKGGRAEPPFYSVNEKLPIVITLVMGLQHALAMVGGLVVPPLLIGQLAKLPDGKTTDADLQRQLVNTAMICSGLFTLTHAIQFPITRSKWVYGSGILSCTGISFTFLTNTQAAIMSLQSQGYSFDQAFGKCLGTLMVCCWITVAMSFLPPRAIRRIFPPLVPGVVIFLIGASLIQSAFRNWGGGAYCAEHTIGVFPLQNQTCLLAPTGAVNPANSDFTNRTLCYKAPTPVTCTGNGNVKLIYGSSEYIGLGFATFMILFILELFGSPMMRNSQVIIALLLGYLIAGVTTHGGGKHYVTTAAIKASPGITFLWVKTFPIGFYAPAVLPYLVGFIILGVEVIGDVTATAEVSHIETEGPVIRRRIRGALLADGFNCFLAACAMMLPVTTFAQNNGVINITRCASRIAGIACGCWLLLLGIIAPIGAFFTSIPNCVLGGVTAFLFANVAVSGIKIIVLGNLQRRNRFILSMSIAVGLGTTLVPEWSQNNLWNETPTMGTGTRGFRDACIIVLESGYSIGFLIAVILHLILPMEDDNPDITNVKKGLYDPTAPRHGNPAYDDDSPHKPVQPSMMRDDTAGRREHDETVPV